MTPLIASDKQTTAAKLRHALSELGHECLSGHVVSVEQAAQLLATSPTEPDLVLLVLPDDPERCLAQLRRFRAQTSATLVAVGGVTDAGQILGAVHAGADDYLNEDGDLKHELETSLARIEGKAGAASADGLYTVVTSGARGSGASVVAANLAVAHAQESGVCRLLDLDLRNGAQAALFDIKPQHTIADLCRNLDRLDRKILDKSLVVHASGVQLLAAPPTLSEAEHVTGEGIRNVLDICRSSRPRMVIDLADAYDDRQSGLLGAAASVFVVFRLDISALRGLSRVLSYWDEHQIDAQRIHLVANRCGQQNELPPAEVERYLRRKIEFCIPDDPSSVNLSVNCGTPVLLESPKSAIARALRGLSQRYGESACTGPKGLRRFYDSRWSKFAHQVRSAFAPLTARVAE